MEIIHGGANRHPPDTPPRRRPERQDHYAPAEAREFLDAAHADRLHAMYELALRT
ncbi:hypothetical protein [Streptomyces sp. McG3]|uniref:hypothetical protein n=1 Tax=Streptomyces sp. McG3 TaxID=2725483 RepID=UPI0035A95630